MDAERLKKMLADVRDGRLAVDEAAAAFQDWPFEDLGYAKVDHHRAIRCGFPEVIYGEGKTVDQLAGIFAKLVEGGGNVLATRATDEQFERVKSEHAAAEYHESARAITLRQKEADWSSGTIAIVSAGTSDQPVAEEARVTAEMMDQRTIAIYDAGVAGIHRLLAHRETLQSATVCVVVAGMEGALPSVVGGLVTCPVIAVPTSVGYGASLGGVAALLAMLNCCASGVTVVNIDAGFSAGYAAALINRVGQRSGSDG